ncbi:MAG: hypothetical protein EAZ97_06725 [Bacteroidetes bacterium]|nr:MAG: hypothetical protein EAZ97_06725 [Bacteroidota bacterium]
MKKFLFTIFVCFLVVFESLYAQDILQIQALNKQAMELLQNKKLDQAIEISKKNFELSVNFPEEHLKNMLILAKAYRGKGDASNSLKYYLQILKIDEDLKDDRSILDTDAEIGTLYQESGVHKKALVYLNNAYKQSTANNNDKKTLLKQIALSQRQLKQYARALSSYEELLNLCQHSASLDLQNTLYAVRNMVEVQKDLGKYEKAMEINRRVIEIARQMKDSTSLAVALNNGGFLGKYLGKNPEALQDFREAFDIEQKLKLPEKDRMVTLVNIGIIYQNLKDYENSVAFLLQALKMIEKEGNNKTIASTNNLIATVYLSMQDYSLAENYNQKAISLANNDFEVLESANFTASQIARRTGNFRQALTAYEKYAAYGDSILKQRDLQREAELEAQINLEQTEKEVKLLMVDKEIKALAVEKYQLQAEKKEQEVQLLKKQNDLEIAGLRQKELDKERVLQDLLLKQQQNQAEVREQEISGLQKDKHIQELALQQGELQKKEGLQKIELLNTQKASLEQAQKYQEELRKQDAVKQRFTYLVAASLSLLLIFMIFAYRRNQKQAKLLAVQKDKIELANTALLQTQEEILAQSEHLKQANEEILAKNDSLEDQKRIIEHKNKNITDSINYAKRIQTAMLPSDESILEALPESFVFFRPRDVVSGDCYWFAEKHHICIIAAVDCTGHGVPGAFMSMIANDLLNLIVHDKEVHRPDLILNQLHKLVRKALKQGETNSKDGMDVTISTYHKNTKIVECAGAMNPIIYIQNNELHTLKADKMPIGGEQKEMERIFTNHEVSVAEPTTFYLFTDGFQDQFGGAENRKYMIKNFRELLFEIYQKPMEEQHDILENTIKNWMGKKHQIDDILVIGFRAN